MLNERRRPPCTYAWEIDRLTIHIWLIMLASSDSHDQTDFENYLQLQIPNVYGYASQTSAEQLRFKSL